MIPISSTITFPQCSFPGNNKCPGFFLVNVIVSLDFNAAPWIFPVSPLIPEGISIDIQYGFFRFIFSIIFFKFPEIFFFNPEPKSASIITSLLDV